MGEEKGGKSRDKEEGGLFSGTRGELQKKVGWSNQGVVEYRHPEREKGIRTRKGGEGVFCGSKKTRLFLRVRGGRNNEVIERLHLQEGRGEKVLFVLQEKEIGSTISKEKKNVATLRRGRLRGAGKIFVRKRGKTVMTAMRSLFFLWGKGGGVSAVENRQPEGKKEIEKRPARRKNIVAERAYLTRKERKKSTHHEPKKRKDTAAGALTTGRCGESSRGQRVGKREGALWQSRESRWGEGNDHGVNQGR